ncbi:MAG: MBL fold metallo-hydrolase, partial [Bacteroidales bacterium]|nr:MBL fold metallo-hydrolase [Bacteroidales bacterium]
SILIDNNPHPYFNLLSEHGLSMYFEVDHRKWLIDVGNSDQFFYNAQKLNIDIADIDFLILSHAHNDHTGGLKKFLEVNNKAKIYFSSEAINKSFFSLRRNMARNISPDIEIVKKYHGRFVWVTHNLQVSQNVTIISHIPKVHPLPKANAKLVKVFGNHENPDDFDHELIVIVKLEEGIVVFSGCSHTGILNILQAVTSLCGNIPIIGCVGGTHLLDSDEINSYETESELAEIGRAILLNYPQMQLITGHCTGNVAKSIFQKILGHKFKTFYTGYSYSFGS